MFKLLMFFIILGLVIIFSISIFRIFKQDLKYAKNEQDDFDIDSSIIRLKEAIKKAETRAKNGSANAEADLILYREKLKEAEELKEKTKNL